MRRIGLLRARKGTAISETNSTRTTTISSADECNTKAKVTVNLSKLFEPLYEGKPGAAEALRPKDSIEEFVEE